MQNSLPPKFFRQCLPLLLGGLTLLAPLTSEAQKKPKSSTSRDKKAAQDPYPEKLYNGMTWRSIGPYRGGRSATVTGVPGKPNLYYFGATGGGVWRTKDGGASWENISDKYFGGSIGAVAVSEADPNVIYVGEGEKTVRGNVSSGFGMWKSEDAGLTWKHIGLKDSKHISRVRIHPKNPDLVYAAAMGNIYAPNDMRGVYRSKDGGKNWERVLFVNKEVGVVDLTIDPVNPRNLYATSWRVQRTPYSLSSGGPGSGIWKSTDGGDTWKEISRATGLPKGTLGIIGVTVSPVNNQRVWALVEAEDGGLFRSENGGESWTKVNEDRSLRQRAWYYTRLTADPQNIDGVYVLNVGHHYSTDGGKTFKSISTPHSDHHDLWIAPEDPKRMIIADDGGAQVSFDGGENWSTPDNQPTGQFYRVVTDNAFPYRIYGAQQDNSAVRIASRTSGRSIGQHDWEETAGSESAHIAVNPKDPEIVYGGNYGGFIGRLDHKTGFERTINVWPDNPMGHGAEGMKYRFQWNFPIFFSPHNANRLYTTSNHVHVTTNEGQSWEVISPDLTRNDKSKLGPSGGPITKDNTSVEYYGTIFAAMESPAEEGVIWTGSDDGLVHVTRDAGKTWTNVTPKALPEWSMINSVDPHPTQKGVMYMAATLYKTGDFQPLLFKTTDYGKTWTKITTGIPATHFTRVVRADPKRPGLLYAGTEYGMYISFNEGTSWKPFRLNLPLVPITDLTIKNDNLIAATQGRGFWIIDDLTLLHQLTPQLADGKFHLFKPMPTYKTLGANFANTKFEGQNHPGGVMMHFYLPTAPDTTSKITLELLEKDGKLIKKYTYGAKEAADKLEAKTGLNRFVWNMTYPEASRFEGMILWGGGTQGPKAIPGTYKARLTVNGQPQETEFVILQDPRSQTPLADLQAQQAFLLSVRDKLTETHDAISKIREARTQMNAVTARFQGRADMKDVLDAAKAMNKKMTEVEETLYQTKNRSGQDPLNFPIRLNNKLANLASQASVGDFRPTDQMYAFQKEVMAQIDEQLKKLNQVFATDLPALNQLIRSKNVDAIMLKEKKETK
ncbi:WD40/YVTN/BNR-like repeat-containing protein [Rufibacter latericius]|uniref:Glycosyl hydrolase n=1 Tax=Rufibacter latericius TaxID=2487040 RepID=A0A3M9ML87_9BACT|nr:glycosyl hydrolase [Rufibacter latericius]RNI26286.1 glycosyl hydrolase [Rufibacter latericius]